MIIDFHTHVFPEKIAAATVAALAKSGNAKPHSDATVQGLLSSLESAGADIAVNMPVLTKPSQFDGVARFAKEICDGKYGSRRIISFAGAHPDMDGVDEKLGYLKRLGFVGIKIHPDYQNTFIDDERYVRIVESAKKYGLIVLTHAGQDGAYVGQPIKCTPRRVLNLLDKIGGYGRLVLAHIGGNEIYGEVYSELCGRDVYFDTVLSLHGISEYDFKRIVEKHGEDKILFGSDSPWQDIKTEIEIIRGYRLGTVCENKIFSENAVKILGL
ncbi:MAG: metal-dependent hydrolase [Ruminococcaceae bacterium]|nr:metal-dependent hydrolase [Oscillospiraceae bacterium]